MDRRKPWLEGVRASIAALIVIVGAIAGTTKSCMPDLDWSIFAGQMQMRAIFEVPFASVFVLPAFVFAACRFSPRMSFIVVLALFLAAAVAVYIRNGSTGMYLLLVAVTSAIGLLYQLSGWMRRYGILVAVAAAGAIGVAIFSAIPYGRNDCWL